MLLRSTSDQANAPRFILTMFDVVEPSKEGIIDTARYLSAQTTGEALLDAQFEVTPLIAPPPTFGIPAASFTALPNPNTP